MRWLCRMTVDCGLWVSLFLAANLPHPPWCCCPHAALHPIWDGDCALFRSASAPTDSAVCAVSTVVESCEQRYKNNILMLKQKLQMEQFDSHTQTHTRKHRHTWRALRAKMDLGATPETEIRCVDLLSFCSWLQNVKCRGHWNFWTTCLAKTAPLSPVPASRTTPSSILYINCYSLACFVLEKLI